MKKARSLLLADSEMLTKQGPQVDGLESMQANEYSLFSPFPPVPFCIVTDLWGSCSIRPSVQWPLKSSDFALFIRRVIRPLDGSIRPIGDPLAIWEPAI